MSREGVGQMERVDPPADGQRQYRALYAVLIAGVSAYALLQSLVIPVLPTIQQALHTTQGAAAWVLTVYLLSASVFTPIIGRLGDMWGKKPLLLVALGGLIVGCAVSAVAHSIGLMIVGRAIQGLGGGLLPLSFGMIRDRFPSSRVAGAVGVIAALTAAGAGLGLVLAGPIVSALSFRWLFWIPMAALVVAAIGAWIILPQTSERIPGRINWLAAALMSVWLVAFLVPLSEGPQWGWGSPKVIVPLVAAVILAVSWGVIEFRSKNPLVDMRMMRIPVVWTANLVALLFGMGMYAVFAFLPQYVQTPKSAGYGFGATLTQSGSILLPASVIMFFGGLLCGRLTLRFGAKAVLVVGSCLSVVPFAMLAFARSSIWEVILAMAIMGAGFGLAFSAMSSLVVEGVPINQTGVASGMNANIRTIGGSIGTAAMASVVTSSAHDGMLPTDAGYTHGFILLCVCAIGAAAASLLIPRHLKPPTAEELRSALPHPELGMVAGGTLLGDESE
jgi:EmrB/QacA subfamily drug resistance transporter